MGMIASIFVDSDSNYDCSNGGISSRHRRVCVMNVEGPSQPDADIPAVVLLQGALGSVKIVPVECEGKQTMFGGAFVHTSDSRFSRAVEKLLGHRFYGAVALHDRVE